jgi:hypothetical protein
MVKVVISQGMSLDILMARILRENGLHVIKVHNGIITHHGKLERVRNEDWVLEEMDTQKRPKKAKKELEEESSET